MYTLKQYLAGRNWHPDLLSVLQGLSDMYGDDLRFLSRDTKWINFVVMDTDDEELFQDLQDSQDDLFGEDFSRLPHFHLVRPWGHSPVRGVFLLHMGSTSLRNEFRGGFWYY
ncbi:MAG TPA: hypothetical protein VK619_06720 [Pyrinomonadaceae bacterium]|nr:hypothetical protein [Pyrinomonadaceae bacterium]